MFSSKIRVAAPDESTRALTWITSGSKNQKNKVFLDFDQLGKLKFRLVDDSDIYKGPLELDIDKLRRIYLYDGCDVVRQAKIRVKELYSINSAASNKDVAIAAAVNHINHDFIGSDYSQELFKDSDGRVFTDDDRPKTTLYSLGKRTVHQLSSAETCYNSRLSRRKAFESVFSLIDVNNVVSSAMTDKLYKNLMDALFDRETLFVSGFSTPGLAGQVFVDMRFSKYISDLKRSGLNGQFWSSKELGDGDVSFKALKKAYALSIGSLSFGKQWVDLESSEPVVCRNGSVTPLQMALALTYAKKKKWIVNLSRNLVDQVDISEFNVDFSGDVLNSLDESYKSVANDFFSFKGRDDQEQKYASFGANSIDYPIVSTGFSSNYRGLVIGSIDSMVDIRMMSILSQYGLCCFDKRGYTLFEVVCANGINLLDFTISSDSKLGLGRKEIIPEAAPELVWFKIDKGVIPIFTKHKVVYCSNLTDYNEPNEILTPFLTEWLYLVKNPQSLIELNQRRSLND